MVSVIIRSFNGVPKGCSRIMFCLYFSHPNPIKFLFKPVFFLVPFLWLLCFLALPLCDVQITFYQRWGNQRQPESWIKIVGLSAQYGRVKGDQKRRWKYYNIAASSLWPTGFCMSDRSLGSDTNYAMGRHDLPWLEGLCKLTTLMRD